MILKVTVSLPNFQLTAYYFWPARISSSLSSSCIPLLMVFKIGPCSVIDLTASGYVALDRGLWFRLHWTKPCNESVSYIYLHVPIISFAVENQVEKRFRNTEPEVIPSTVLGNTTNSSGYTLKTRYKSLRRSHKTNSKLFTVCKCTFWQFLWILRSFFEILARFLNERIRLYYTIRPGNVHLGLSRTRWTCVAQT